MKRQAILCLKVFEQVNVVVLKALKKSNNISLTELPVFFFSSKYECVFCKTDKTASSVSYFSCRQIVMGQCNLSLNCPIYRGPLIHTLSESVNRIIALHLPGRKKREKSRPLSQLITEHMYVQLAMHRQLASECHL